ncbi:unnamed protein product [Mytilus edulis]|uniref:Uncharacterized protein n=1 Tax=Mytilus edulis TaxID=6550 RepID=A0A8S3VDN0_MYTED|nr:unnamed protein product [Mytilus edulis]
MSKSPYISDALLWQEAINKASYLKKEHNNQLGRGISRRYGRKRFVILKKDVPKNETRVEQVAPTAAIEHRAVSELIQQTRDKDPHIKQEKAKSVGIKGKKSKPRTIQVEKLKGARGKTQKAKNRAPPKTKHYTKNRKINLETEPSIFDKRTTKKWRI